MTTQTWRTLNRWQRAVVVVIGILQIGLFIAAWTDLNHRTSAQLNGSKRRWRAALFLNGVGPLAYFLKGRKPNG